MKTPLVLAGLMTLAGSSLAVAQPATCAQWDVSQPLTLQQGAYRVEFNIGTQRPVFAATASYFQPDEYVHNQWIRVPAFGYNINGLHTAAVSGSIRGDSIEMHTQWGAVYAGKIDANGRIEGMTSFKGAPNASARWHSRGNLKCSIIASPAPGPMPGTAAAAMCKSGYVWREARPSDLVCVTPASRSRVAEENRTAASRVVDRERGGARGQCIPGFVWREAYVGDVVCVTPAVRTLVRDENLLASTRVASPTAMK